jgi:hypothetical protein
MLKENIYRVIFTDSGSGGLDLQGHPNIRDNVFQEGWLLD